MKLLHIVTNNFPDQKMHVRSVADRWDLELIECDPVKNPDIASIYMVPCGHTALVTIYERGGPIVYLDPSASAIAEIESTLIWDGLENANEG